jgi:hypothetical protein
MAIVDDYAGIAAELRRIREAERPKPPVVMVHVSSRGGAISIEVDTGQPRRGVLARRGWSTD